jgi:heme O synthase-like polyprenyltransferase
MRMNRLKFFRTLTLTGAVYGFFGWVYIVINSEVHMWTLHMQLTHFYKWPHEDTFGEMCFAFSIICFFVYNLIKEDKKRSN